VLRRSPRHADAHFLLGVAAAGRGSIADALDALGCAVALEPARADYHAQHARCLAMAKRDMDAFRSAETALACGPRDALTLDTVGVVLSRMGAHERALAAFRAAVASAPDNPSFRFNLAASLRIVGELAAAEEAFEAVVRAVPTFYRAYSALADLRSQRRGGTKSERPAQRVQRLLELLDNGGCDVDGELHLRYALAKEYEALGEYAAAFDQLRAGKAHKRRSLGYSFAVDRALFESVETICGEHFVAQSSSGGDRSEAPIFVIGMPRTGTTLVERILSSHSIVASAGEQQTFGLCIKRAAGTPPPRVLDPATIEAAAAADFAAIGSAYLKAVRGTLASSGHGSSERFVDKMPLNFFYAAMIDRALPNARIVCMRRDPLDTCISNFRQLFALDFPYYGYAYDLSDIGRYYVVFDRLLAHWERVLPGKILPVRYEELVSDPVTQTRRLLDFCELPWDDRCLDFPANAAPVATASAAQVREPVNTRSVGRWRCYAPQLAALREELLAAGIMLQD
jgi:tetratricopeptide (TPR) repeat protein